MTQKEHDGIRFTGSPQDLPQPTDCKENLEVTGRSENRPGWTASETKNTGVVINELDPDQSEPQAGGSDSRYTTTSNPQMRNVAASVVVSEILRELDRGI